MKKFKSLFLCCISTILAISFLIAPFSVIKRNPQASAETTTEIKLIDKTMLSHVTLSTNSQALTTDNIKSVDTNNDKVADTSYVFAKGNVTASFDCFADDYYLTYTSSYFSKFEKSVSIQKDTVTNEFPISFTYNEETYYYKIDPGDNIHIYEKESEVPATISTPFAGSDLISYVDSGNTRTIKITESITFIPTNLPASVSSATLSFVAKETPTTTYTINFEKTVADFDTENVTMFTCTGNDVGATPFVNAKIEREKSYETLNFQLTNNDYTENNPLYFDINYNGFVYNFKLFSKTIETSDLLFVEYFDTKKESHNQSLATTLNSSTGAVVTPIYKYVGATTNFNMFDIDFNNIGRYEISVYDSTYLLGYKKNNYYSTSFYIKNGLNSAYENAYAILQSYDDDGNFLDYIVSNSTQNTSVKITVKNLLYYFENDEVLKNYTVDDEHEDLPILQFIKTTLTGSLNIPVSTYYTLSQLKEQLSSRNPDFSIDCSDDAFYEILIYKYKKVGEVVSRDTTENLTKEYQFTVVKQPKISFTYYEVDTNYDPIPIEGTNKYSTALHEADVPYVIDPITYNININSNMILDTKFIVESVDLKKTYVNEYVINYAMQKVNIEGEETEATEEDPAGFTLTFSGVGDINVEITNENGTKTTKVFQTGEKIILTEYGTYTVKITDEMGTVGTGVFSYTKPVSISSILLIASAGVVVLVIVLLVITSRGKVATR